MTRILHISKYYYPYIGGTEQVARDVVNALNGENIEQKVICFNADVDDADKIYKKGDNIVDAVDGVKVYRCACQIKIASQSISLSYKKQLKHLMDSFKPDIVTVSYTHLTLPTNREV